MTSEIEAKTNEFLRRRKLRLQQVREQSKEIAKKIRQRAKVEKLRQVVDLDSTKQREYLRHQEKLINKLEQLHAKSLENVGASHKGACETGTEEQPELIDLSKIRGKEAASELRRQKQEKLDQQKKLLDRKLQAREVANEISRDKSVSVAHKVAKSLASKCTENSVNLPHAPYNSEQGTDRNDEVTNDKAPATKSDMGTQWDLEEISNEWEPAIPALSLPKDDSEDTANANNNSERKTEKGKRTNLFALSEEMPSSLCGGLADIPEERTVVRSSLNIVSEYLQNRALRLRETDTMASSKKQNDELTSIKQTILRTRAAKNEGPRKSENISQKSSLPESSVTRKSSVTMYNHSTRDTRDVPRNEERLVVRDSQPDEDAYSLAMRISEEYNKDKDYHKKTQNVRNKVAMSKQNIEKEYRDTMTFLNSLPKDKGNKPIRNAYKDDHQQQMQREHRQQKMQHEYKKIEKQCKKHSCVNTKCRKTQIKSKSPVTATVDDDFNSRDFQYSWMPVPESDGSLAIHTIPTTLKEGKPGNTVTFSKIDSYHEYRSRHKHTPPTKDTGLEKQTKRNVERVFIQNGSESDISSTDTSSVENLQVGTHDTRLDTTEAGDADGKISDAERIIIYKILDSKTDKKKRMKAKLSNRAKSTSSKHNKSSETNDIEQIEHLSTKEPEKEPNQAAFEQLTEGVYKTVSEKGDNISSMYFSECPQDNINSEKTRPPQCQNCQGRHQAAPSNINSEMHWELGNNAPSMSLPGSSVAYTCRCSNKRQAHTPIPQQPYPSAATSTSSFKTATTDKANSAIRDGGYIKLIDEGGQEAGKFYIGATGFLKDDAYEVVIQLRKRDADKGDEKKNQSKVSEEEQLVSVNNYTGEQMSEQSAQQMTQGTGTTKGTAEFKENEESDLSLRNHPISNDASKVTNLILTEQEPKLPSQTVLIKNMDHSKSTKDKGVDTMFQDSFVVPDHVPKVDPVPRPATSTYTQTSLSSPNPRPAFFHMSSSTSTAYMSPPEVILPGLFKQHNDLADDEMYDSIENINLHEDRSPRCNNVDCTCKNCIHGRKDKTVKLLRAKLNTPPNTAKSSKHHVHKHDVTSNTLGYSKRCHKCGNCTKSKICLKINKNRHYGTSSKKSARNLVMRVNSSAVSSYKSKNTTNRSMGSKINPHIKDYVDKLLALNRESLRAIDVVDQECSSVATPGSSIINVPLNVDKSKPLENKISLEQIKNIVKQHLFDDHYKREQPQPQISNYNPNTHIAFVRRNNIVPRLSKRKQVHKVKSLNISKQLFKQNHTIRRVNEQKQNIGFMSGSETQEEKPKKPLPIVPPVVRPRSKSSPTPRRVPNLDDNRKSAASDIVKANTAKVNIAGDSNKYHFENKHTRFSTQKPIQRHTFPTTQKHIEQSRRKMPSPFISSRATVTPPSIDSDSTEGSRKGRSLPDIPMDTSTQTSGHVDPDINYMKLAENKLQNMEKIANLTEKCTKRLSNLAKVLEEVRKNKSLAYSQISTSDSASDADQKSEKNVTEYKSPVQFYDQIFDIQKRRDIETPEAIYPRENENTTSEYVPMLSDIPKPETFKIPIENLTQTNKNLVKSIAPHSPVENLTKNRAKPPPALTRISLKRGHEYIVPHELSTVIEVDSPMSMKVKNQSTGNENKDIRDEKHQSNLISEFDLSQGDPDLLRSNTELRKNLSTIRSESSNDSKLQMMDLKQFNDIMLKPFLSIHEYAKQRDIGGLEEGSNLEDIPRNDGENDDVSSLHSDGSLPDVIAELLKRNIISEPFKFETTSNVNSTTVSSESTLSVLALSKIRKEKKKSSVMFSNKENVAETSDTLSISSNPDLEHAFKKLGMGWASSTLKKTKERLALSSSSNTSSSSLSHFKIKTFNNNDVPVLVTDSISSALNLSKKDAVRKVMDTSKNAEQQTSMTNSMTVKEFLTNELAKKITFTNKSNRSTTEEEFVSLYETRMPEQMKHSSQMIREERSMDSLPSGTNRARTSTPVQLFKSMTYRSSSSSNVSNGLFSNADDLSSVKGTSNSIKNQTTSDKDDLTVPNISLRLKGPSDCSKSE